MRLLSVLLFLGFNASMVYAVENNKKIEPIKMVKHDEKNKVDLYEATNLYVANVLDPASDMNHVFSNFNASLVDGLQPVSEVYASDYLIPIRWPLKAASNVLNNVKELGVGTVSNLLVGDFDEAGISVLRFLVNATMGLGGILPMADTLAEAPVSDAKSIDNMSIDQKILYPLRSDVTELKKPAIDSFSQVFHEWGFGCGIYVVFPVLGGQTTQQVLGTIAETPLRPETFVKPIILVRMAGNIDTALTQINALKPFLKDIDLSDDDGKRQFYNLARLSVLNANKCYTEKDVREYAEEEGLDIEEDDLDL